ncbi:MAG: hypothetical protein PHF51_03975 [Candidatus ainarchaeum sp.]|nr:hypothetical protein [Candidatus ainarchaeum sp.]
MKVSGAAVAELYARFRKRSRIPLHEAAAILKIPEQTALSWAKLLEKDGMIGVSRLGEDVYLAWSGKKARGGSAAEYRQKLAEAGRRGGELKALTDEQAKVVYKKFIPLERKFDAELQLINERLAEDEREILEFEKRMQALPAKLARLGDNAEKLDKIEAYARKNLNEARVRIEAESGRIREAQASIDEHMRDVASRVDEQSERVKRIEKELMRLRKIEQWMSIQETELEKGVEELARQKGAVIDDFAKVKRSISPEAVKEMLRELREIGERYSLAVHDVMREEAELGERITEEKKALVRAVSEGVCALRALPESGQAKKRGARGGDDEWKRFLRDLDEIASSNIE